jgi:hypothetical protein
MSTASVPMHQRVERRPSSTATVASTNVVAPMTTVADPVLSNPSGRANSIAGRPGNTGHRAIQNHR